MGLFLFSNVLFNGIDGALFQPGDLGLGDAYLGGDFHLGFALVKTQGQDAPLPFIQPRQGILQGNAIRPQLVGVSGIADLVHDADGITAVRVDRLI